VSTPSTLFERATEGLEHPRGGARVVAFVSAIVAVLAAIGSLFAHQKSIQALDIKNRALHESIRASDQIAYYQAKRVRVGLYAALLAADVARDAQGRENLKKAMAHEETTSLVVLDSANQLEAGAARQEDQAEAKLHSFETFEIATAAFEVSIVLVSISALTRTILPLWTAIGLSAIGVVAMAIAFAQGM
jgi:hypothetical protein